MSIEYNPEGIACNLACPYCYEHPQRDAGNFKKNYNEDAVKQALSDEGGTFTIFGGEPLLASIEHLESMWKWGFEKYRQNGIQTNATLINDEHIELFRKYNVHVGISMDGPGALNDSRWRTNLEDTREATQKSEQNLYRLIKHNEINCSLIVTLYQGNVRNRRFKKLKKWFKKLDDMGLRHARIHLLEVDHEEVADKMKLTDDENVECLIELHDLEKTFKNLTFDIFSDIRNLLLGNDSSVTCVWNACDPLTTSAVRGVDSNGDRHNCGRTNKDGVNWFKADKVGHERQLALYHTPWKDNGCKGCRFFAFCKGECPGTGEEADWRNKTDQCWVWYKLFEHVEQTLIDEGYQPISLHPKLKQIEQVMLQWWARGDYASINAAKSVVESSKNISNRIPNNPFSNIGHGDEHGDAPHGDHTDESLTRNNIEHGDHTDESLLRANNNSKHGDEHGDAPHGDHTDAP